ncbi:MAG: orotate phosphoribosyltransferase [Candidatus Dadabacteria bacterium]|nr:orotate phosphoribosyltransferase [Candidatus Dadabacteria bacterium]
MNKSREKLKLILKSKSILLGNFTLASGKQSSYYIDARLTTLDPEGAHLISEIFLDKIAAQGDVTAVGGPSTGADPMVGAIISRSYERSMPLRGFIVRKKEKEHGTGNMIEGGLTQGDSVAIVEDVITTGGSVRRAIDLVESAGAEVRGVLCVVDRGEETEKAFLERGCSFFSIFRVSELL